MNGPNSKQIYSFDTSALIDGIERFYPITNFPAFWERMDSLIDEGRLRVSQEAWNESLAGSGPLREWCTEAGFDRERCIYPTDDVVGPLAGVIAAQFPR